MSETKNPEVMVQDQNLNSTPNTGMENTEKTIEEMENTETIPEVQTIGTATGSTPPNQEDVKNEEPTVNETAPTETSDEDTVQDESDTTESAATMEDGNTDTPPSEEELEAQRQSKRDELLALLNAGRRVQLREFRDAGFKFADMDDSLQRKETLKDSRQLLESLKTTKAFYRPIEILPVNEMIEAGHPCFKLDGTEITPDDPDYFRYFVRPDGKQRTIAYAKLMSDPKHKGKENEYSVHVMRCPCDINEIETYIREIQTAAVWDEKTKRQTVVAKLGGEESGLTLMNTFMTETGMSARGAYKLIYRKDGYKKDLYEQSMRSGTLDDKLKASAAIIKRAKDDYRSIRIAFRDHLKFLKNSVVPDCIIDTFTTETDAPKEAVQMFLTFLKSLQPDDFAALEEVSGLEGKKTKLMELYAFHKENLETDPNYPALVEERVATAESEYEAAEKKAASEEKAKTAKTSIEAKYYSI